MKTIAMFLFCLSSLLFALLSFLMVLEAPVDLVEITMAVGAGGMATSMLMFVMSLD